MAVSLGWRVSATRARHVWTLTVERSSSFSLWMLSYFSLAALAFLMSSRETLSSQGSCDSFASFLSV